NLSYDIAIRPLPPRPPLPRPGGAEYHGPRLIGRRLRLAKKKTKTARSPRAARPSDGQETMLSFRVDRHLAETLMKLPDRSAFIRRAILRAFYRVCPACQGKGVLPEPAARP